jgi:hypothetical protein
MRGQQPVVHRYERRPNERKRLKTCHVQVSKTAEAGEYIKSGGFIIRGTKHYIATRDAALGFGFLFRLSEASSSSKARRAIDGCGEAGEGEFLGKVGGSKVVEKSDWGGVVAAGCCARQGDAADGTRIGDPKVGDGLDASVGDQDARGGGGADPKQAHARQVNHDSACHEVVSGGGGVGGGGGEEEDEEEEKAESGEGACADEDEDEDDNDNDNDGDGGHGTSNSDEDVHVNGIEAEHGTGAVSDAESMLVACPGIDDSILYALPMVGPYSAFTNYRWAQLHFRSFFNLRSPGEPCFVS